MTFLLPYFFPKTCEHSITKILDSINRIQNKNCKNILYGKIQEKKNKSQYNSDNKFSNKYRNVKNRFFKKYSKY